jgi:hypothetical protein
MVSNYSYYKHVYDFYENVTSQPSTYTYSLLDCVTEYIYLLIARLRQHQHYLKRYKSHSIVLKQNSINGHRTVQQNWSMIQSLGLGQVKFIRYQYTIKFILMRQINDRRRRHISEIFLSGT